MKAGGPRNESIGGESYLKDMREYRDKFLAHLDADSTMHIPKMDLAERAINYLDRTMRGEQDRDTFRGLPPSLRSYAADCHQAAIEVYASAT